MKKLLQYLGNYKKESILGPLFKLLEASFELIVPLVMAAIIDTGVASRSSIYYEDESGTVSPGADRIDLCHHGAVFCGESGGWLCDRIKTCSV